MSDNCKAQFVVDEEKHKEELEDLYALKKVRDAISKKKKEIKDKDFLQKHPKLKDLVQSHRRRKIEADKPAKEGGKIPLNVTHPKVEVELDDKPIAKPKDLDIDVDALAEKVAEKMIKKQSKPEPVKVQEPSAEVKFNQTISKAPPIIKTTIANSQGKWF
tara:strand:+ start:2686 stop:3165 length:480 start_codon:yes stop_codon:yes gene_type:complete